MVEGAKLHLKEWLLRQIESGSFEGLCWEDEDKTMFRIPWKHAAKKDYNQMEDAALFKVWKLELNMKNKRNVRQKKNNSVFSYCTLILITIIIIIVVKIFVLGISKNKRFRFFFYVRNIFSSSVKKNGCINNKTLTEKTKKSNQIDYIRLQTWRTVGFSVRYLFWTEYVKKLFIDTEIRGEYGSVR